MNHYEEKQEARRERLLDAAHKADSEASSAFRRDRAIMDMIPMGQPILVGHHSERRHRRDLARSEALMRRGITEQQRAEELRRRAASVGKGGISSDDPDAIDKIRERVAKLKRDQASMIAANRIVRKYKTYCADALAALVNLELGFTQRTAEELFKPDFCGRVGFADYMTKNNGANIRRLEQRIEQLERDSKRETKEIEPIDGLRIVHNAEDNRVQLFFNGKPAENIRRELKGRGFRWSPFASAWQRHLNNGGIYAAQSFAEWYKARA